MFAILFLEYSIRRHAPRVLWICGIGISIIASSAVPIRCQTAATHPPPIQLRQSTSATTNAPIKKSVSVADAAIAARKQCAQHPPASIVFTNDHLPTVGGVSVVGQRFNPAENTVLGIDGKATGANVAKGETYWRQRFAEVRTKLRQAQEAAGIMQRELGELNVQYYPNPQQALAQSITRSDINEKVAAIAAKKAEIAGLQQQISNMEDELRKSGSDPGWAREWFGRARPNLS